MNDLLETQLSASSEMSVEEKIAFLTGFDFWNTVPNAKIGLRKMLVSDGPSGVRGEFWDERDNSLNLPSGTALGSTWSRDFAAEYGHILAKEALRKGVDVILGPTINLHRSPFGGRHFECLSEDAMLTGVLSVSYIRALQTNGKAACPKHFVGNDFETDRYNVDVQIDERTLREIYLRPFEECVVQGGAWALMSSYNKVNGTSLSESPLLQDPLRGEWKFEGVVISDWGAVRSVEAAKAEQDLAMPGPKGAWGDALLQAVRNGEISEATIDRKIKRLLLLATKVGALGTDGRTPNAPQRHNEISAEGISFARRAVSEGSVLLQNDGILPLNFAALDQVALIGHNANAARTQGGGSATVLPKSVVTPLSALKDILGERVSYSIGAVVQAGLAPLNPAMLVNPMTGKSGVHVEFLNQTGEVLFTEEREVANLTWLGSHAPVSSSNAIRLRTRYTPNLSSTELFGFASTQPVQMTLNGLLFINEHLPKTSNDPFVSLMDPPFTSQKFDFVAGESVEVDIRVDLSNREGLAVEAQSITFGFEVDESLGDSYIAQAVSEAKKSDVAIVVVGTNAQVESEGIDRTNLSLPGRQDELVEAVIAVNPNTIVVVNSGSPVLLPWRNQVRAILLTYFGGQEMGNGIVDMLTGVTEPGGRLPTTWAQSLSDIPVSNIKASQPGNFVSYDEGIHVGYRAWLKSGAKPAFPFGHGLGYTTWSFENVDLPAKVGAGEDFTASVSLTNSGSRVGKQVVQIYASRKESKIERPVRWLVGFADAVLLPNESREVKVSIRGREFANWDNGWKFEDGTFEIHVGTSVENLELHTSIEIG
jgi:beta-glucosidase